MDSALPIVVITHHSGGSALDLITTSTVLSLKTAKQVCSVLLQITHVKGGLEEINHVMSMSIIAKMDITALRWMAMLPDVMSCSRLMMEPLQLKL